LLTLFSPFQLGTNSSSLTSSVAIFECKSHPQAVKSAEIVGGDGGDGTIKKTNFGEYEGSIIKNTSGYHTEGDVEIKEEHVKAGKEKAHALFKIIETYLVANPDAYN
ncbi:unnamed protein product, partial [Prunus brigantina]